jgi:hypothetical protein
LTRFLSKILLILHQNIFEMRKFLKISTVFFVTLTTIFVISCNRKPINPNVPEADIDIRIYPNTLQYQELNTVGGKLCITADPPSRGIIVYRYNIDQFKAYERLDPNNPYTCPNNRLIFIDTIDYNIVFDTCCNHRYSILTGELIGESGYDLVQYFTYFDGTELRITNH